MRVPRVYFVLLQPILKLFPDLFSSACPLHLKGNQRGKAQEAVLPLGSQRVAWGVKTILIPVLLIVFTFSSCSRKEKSPLIPDNALDPDLVKNPASAEGKKGDVNVPEFSFEKEVHDFGTITDGEKVAYSFSFRNTGNADLIISNATASCGCTVPEYSKDPVPPGKSGVINVVFDSAKRDGYQRKEIFVYANTIPNSKKLIITGTVSKKKN